MQRDRIKFIDGIRAIAVLMVFLFHTNSLLTKHLGERTDLISISINKGIKFFPVIGSLGGHMGVDIFFVLSGYLIFTILYKKPKINPLNFMKQRYLRLFPANFFLIAAVLPARELREIVLNIFMLNAFFVDSKAINFVTWTLSYELLFYFLMSVFFYFMKLKKLKVNWVSLFILFIGISSIFYFVNYQEWNFILPNIRFWGFFAGIVIAKLSIDGINKKTLKSIDKFKIPILIITLLVITFAKLNFSKRWIYYKSLDEVLMVNGGINYIIVVVAFMIIFFVLLHTENIIKKFLELPFLQKLGIISYSFYLSHQYFGFRMTRKILSGYEIHPIAFVLCSISIAFLITYIYSILSYKYLEKPYFNYRKRKLMKDQNTDQEKLKHNPF